MSAEHDLATRLRLAEFKVERLLAERRRLSRRLESLRDDARFLHGVLLVNGVEIPRRADGRKVRVR